MPDFHFSNRTDWSLDNNSLSIALEQLQAKGIPWLDLTESNPTRCGFDYPKSLLDQLADKTNFTYAPVDKGILPARQAISTYYHKRNYNLDPENLVLTSSTSEGYSFLLKLLTNPGDHVLIPKPSYPLFQFLLQLHDVDFDYYPLVYDGAWRIDKQAFEQLLTPKTRCVVLVNPNNPTGSYMHPEDIEFLNRTCLKQSMSIISDEVFLDYQLASDISPKSLVSNMQVPTFILSGISKILGLPQMKLSWIAANGPSNYVKEALKRLEIISDTYLSVNTPVQKALASWLSQAQDIQEQILERVKMNLNVLKQRGLEPLHVQGGWYAILEKRLKASEEDIVLQLLSDDHVLVHPGYFFDFEQEGYLVISLLPETAVFKQAIERIAHRIQF